MTTPKRILFATMPLDGHFNPLTGLAVHLSEQGHDVRWYVGGHYGDKVRKLGLRHYPFVKGKVVNQDNMDRLFPERTAIKGSVARLRFDMKQLFLLRVPEFIDDITYIHQEWPFDLIVHDVAFVAGSFIKELFHVKTASVGIVPLTETDDNLPPSGLGMKPMNGFFGRMAQGLLRYLVLDVMFKSVNELHNQLRQQYGLQPETAFVFDSVVRTADVYLQSGVPSFEYPRKKISSNVRYIGPLLPHSKSRKHSFDQAAKALTFQKVVLVTQGTVEHDVEKIIVPTLEAFKNDPSTLVIATTGGSQTPELRGRYPQENVIIEDFIDFNAVMPYAHVYITNGGYGGVMLGLQHNLPLVVAGVHEGKNEIAARVDYCKVGLSLQTETPKPAAIRNAVNKLMNDEQYRRNVRKMSAEFNQYKPNKLAERYINTLLAAESEPVLTEL